jgi:hypothetical protein
MKIIKLRKKCGFCSTFFKSGFMKHILEWRKIFAPLFLKVDRFMKYIPEYCKIFAPPLFPKVDFAPPFLKAEYQYTILEVLNICPM